MKTDIVVDMLLREKAKFPNLSNLELIELLKLKTMMEGNNKNGR